MQPISQYGVFTQATADAITQAINASQGAGSVGTLYYADYANGNDTWDGRSPATAVKTLAQAYAMCTAGKNDTVVLVSNGASSGFQRISATFTWAKASTHLVGAGNGIASSTRASIRPTSGASAFTPLVTISANGCLFQNIGFWSGFSTGTTAQIDVNLTGDYNHFVNCHFAGMADAASAADADSRCLVLTSADENVFAGCVFGVDTVARSAANASVELKTGSARNVFSDSIFRFQTSASTPLGYIVAAAGGVDRDTSFIRCAFVNQIKSTSTTMSGLGTAAASAGGLFFFQYCSLVGITEYGTDATTRALCYIDGGTVTAATTGIAVNPT